MKKFLKVMSALFTVMSAVSAAAALPVCRFCHCAAIVPHTVNYREKGEFHALLPRVDTLPPRLPGRLGLPVPEKRPAAARKDTSTAAA